MGRKNYAGTETETVEPVAEEVVEQVEQVEETMEKVKATRKPPVAFADKIKVYGMIRDGKGTVDELVEAGVDERAARVTVKLLMKEKLIKQSFVAV
jgi:ribosomal protein L13E